MKKKWQKRLLEFLSLDTTNPPGRNYKKAIAMLAPWCREAGFLVEKVKIPEKIASGRINLLAHRRNPQGKRLLVYSHIDVVPAEEDWHPFVPKIVGGRIFARGVADMKGSLIAFLQSAEEVVGKKLPWDLTLLITTDEETNQKKQIEYLLGRIDRVKKAVFLDLDSTFGYVSIGGLGHIDVKITVFGKSVHSGISHLGVNAVEDSISLLVALERLKRKVEKRFSQIPVNPKLGIAKMQAKLNIDMIKGGLKVNIVPDRCEIEVDRRLIPEEKIEEAKEEIEKALAPLKEKVNFKLDFVHAMRGYGKVSPAAKKMAKIMRQVLGRGDLFGVMGSGDLLGLAEDFSWEMVGVGVGRDKESNIHGRRENARIEDIDLLIKILTRFLLSS